MIPRSAPCPGKRCVKPLDYEGIAYKRRFLAWRGDGSCRRCVIAYASGGGLGPDRPRDDVCALDI